MAALKLIEIPFYKNGCGYFKAIKDLPYPVWLDSGRPKAEFGRFDIISARPSKLLLTKNGSTEISDFKFEITNGQNRRKSQEPSFVGAKPTITTQTTCRLIDSSKVNPFDIIRDAINSVADIESQDLPFTGGLIGYLGYTLSNYLDYLPAQKGTDAGLPDMHLGLYLWSFIQDHELERSYLAVHPECPEALELEAKHIVKSLSDETTKNTNNFKINKLSSNFNFKSYTSAFNKIQDYLAAGDCYQVNFAQRFEALYQGEPSAAYLRLRDALPAPYSAFLGLKDGAVLSHSPEQFLQVEGKQVRTQPIKGTSPRHSNTKIDKQHAARLQSSSKDRSENLMIVDLMRNDLGKNCLAGSVVTTSLFKLKSYANVHHLVSTIDGTLKPSSSAIDLLQDCFPGGSITGAPKRRAMEIIKELETVDRSVYCGSVVYFSANGKMDSSITIRTLVCDGKTIYCWGGGGIVADSTAEAEFQESLDKVQILLDTLSEGS